MNDKSNDDNHANQCNPNNDEYWHSREEDEETSDKWCPDRTLCINKEVLNLSNKGMTQKAASRIQSHADSSGTNQGFKARASAAAAKSNK